MVKQSPVKVGTDVTLQCNADNPASFNSNPGISWYFASNNSKITRNVETGTCATVLLTKTTAGQNEVAHS